MNLYRSCLLGIISTHTLTWSVTGACIVRDVKPVHFNPHAHVERDYLCGEPAIEGHISTHTLTWSVTEFPTWHSPCLLFQLTRSRGAWQNSNGCNVATIYFNSHAHVERDLKSCNVATILRYFNSHAHVERDSFCKCFSLNAWISTHTLTWSVTVLIEGESGSGKFQLTRSRGAWRLALQTIQASLSISTHTLTWSVTQGDLKLFTYGEFQLTRSRGAWHKMIVKTLQP